MEKAAGFSLGENALRWLEILKNTAISHAYLLSGDALHTQAVALQAAAILLCESTQGDKPCTHCKSCKWFAINAHPDFIQIRSQSQGMKKTIRIEAIRILQEEIAKSSQTLRKVVWIDQAHQMPPQAQNALLKVLEEPPSRVVFLLTGWASALLPTIRSRCSIIRLSRGESFCETSPILETAQTLLGNVLKLRSAGITQKISEQYVALKQDLLSILQIQAEILRDCIANPLQAPLLSQKNLLFAQANPVSPDVGSQLIQLLFDAHRKLYANANVSLVIDCLLIEASKILLLHTKAL